MTKPLETQNRGISARLLDQPYLLLILAPLFWGGNVVAAKLVVGEIDPVLLLASRCVLATAVILQYMVGGVYWVESRSRLNPQHWVGLGLLCAGITAASAWLAARPFLSALAWDVSLPVLGHLHFSSVLLFDVGVYMLVVGATVLVLVALAHQSLRAQRKAAADAQAAAQSGSPA